MADERQKLGLCVPWDSPFVFKKFAQYALNLQPPAGFEVNWFWGGGWCPARRHIDACEQAIGWGADLLCILGADQEYRQQDMLQRLVDRWESIGGRGLIAAMIPFRGYVDWQPMQPFEKLAWRWPTLEEDAAGVGLVPIRPEDGDFQKANVIGSGVLLFHKDVLLSMKKPWFYERVDPESMQRVADMDATAISRMQTETGTPLYIDTTIQVQHDHVFSIDESFPVRFADWANHETRGIDRGIIRFREELPKQERTDAAD